MNPAKIFQTGDLHYCPEHLDEVDKCVGFAFDKAIAAECDCAVLSGDIFDHRIELHEPAVEAIVSKVSNLAGYMPVLILQGTFSHDAPGSLDIFKYLDRRHPVHVADRVKQVVFSKFNGWMESEGYTFKDINSVPAPEILFSCLPPVNKGVIAAKAGTGDAAQAAGDYVRDLMRGWSVVNEQARAAGIPTVVVSHGTVNSCITEQGVPMHGQDWELSTGSLFASAADAIMVSHIHQFQRWDQPDGSQTIAYPGSPGRLHFGELTDKGFLIWKIEGGHTGCEFIKTPAKKLIQINFDGPPDMDKLREQAATADGAHVRIRWEIGEENKDSVDRAGIEALFAGAAEVKTEPRTIPLQRQRSPGISQAHALGDKVIAWAQANQVSAADADQMLGGLYMLQHQDPEQIVESLLDHKSTREK